MNIHMYTELSNLWFMTYQIILNQTGDVEQAVTSAKQANAAFAEYFGELFEGPAPNADAGFEISVEEVQ